MIKSDSIKALHKHLGKNGLLVFDAHATATDMVYSIIWFRIHFKKASIIVPTAGWLLHRPLNKFILNSVSKLFKITLIPVYRSEELAGGEEKQYSKYYPKELTYEVRKERNKEYIIRAKEALRTRNSIVMVAPYGNPLKYGKGIKKGALILMKEATHIIASRTIDKKLFKKTNISIFTTDKEKDLDYELLEAFNSLGA